jgi:acylglycerol lipase
MVSIAQLGEHQTVALRVVGSIPTTHPIYHESRDMAQLVAHSLWERGVVSSSLAIPTILNKGIILIKKLLYVFFVFYIHIVYSIHNDVSKNSGMFLNIKNIESECLHVNLVSPEYVCSSKDHIRLAVYEFLNKKQIDEIIIFLPGAGFYANHLYQKMAYGFLQNQKNIVLMDLRGHGLSDGRRGDAPSVFHVMEDIQSVIKHYKMRYQNCKIILAGHSSGAGALINYSQTELIQPDEYIFVTPYLGSRNTKLFKKNNNFIKKVRWWFYIINGIFNIDYFKHRYTVYFNYNAIDRNINPCVVDAYSYEMSLATSPQDPTLIRKIKTPMKIFLAGNDELFDNEEIIKIIGKDNVYVVPHATHLDILLNEQLYL